MGSTHQSQMFDRPHHQRADLDFAMNCIRDDSSLHAKKFSHTGRSSLPCALCWDQEAPIEINRRSNGYQGSRVRRRSFSSVHPVYRASSAQVESLSPLDTISQTKSTGMAPNTESLSSHARHPVALCVTDLSLSSTSIDRDGNLLPAHRFIGYIGESALGPSIDRNGNKLECSAWLRHHHQSVRDAVEHFSHTGATESSDSSTSFLINCKRNGLRSHNINGLSQGVSGAGLQPQIDHLET